MTLDLIHAFITSFSKIVENLIVKKAQPSIRFFAYLARRITNFTGPDCLIQMAVASPRCRVAPVLDLKSCNLQPFPNNQCCTLDSVVVISPSP
jgi:hypothetical protein